MESEPEFKLMPVKVEIKEESIVDLSPPKRGRGRPRIYPVGQSPSQLKTKSRLKKKNEKPKVKPKSPKSTKIKHENVLRRSARL